MLSYNISVRLAFCIILKSYLDFILLHHNLLSTLHLAGHEYLKNVHFIDFTENLWDLSVTFLIFKRDYWDRCLICKPCIPSVLDQFNICEIFQTLWNLLWKSVRMRLKDQLHINQERTTDILTDKTPDWWADIYSSKNLLI